MRKCAAHFAAPFFSYSPPAPSQTGAVDDGPTHPPPCRGLPTKTTMTTTGPKSDMLRHASRCDRRSWAVLERIFPARRMGFLL
jgi:hypothetical protein